MSTLLVVLPQIILCQTLLQPSYSSYNPDSGGLFTPSASYRSQRRVSKSHGLKKASSNWDQKQNPSNYYYQPEAQQSSYDNHRGAQQEQDYSPQSSSHEQVRTNCDRNTQSYWNGKSLPFDSDSNNYIKLFVPIKIIVWIIKLFIGYY